jgi:hypothetical protein
MTERKVTHQLNAEDKKLYFVNCNACWFALTVDQRNKYNCQPSMPNQLAEQSDGDKIKMVNKSYGQKFTQTQTISLLLIGKDCSSSLTDDVCIPRFVLQSC